MLAVSIVFKSLTRNCTFFSTGHYYMYFFGELFWFSLDSLLSLDQNSCLALVRYVIIKLVFCSSLVTMWVFMMAWNLNKSRWGCEAATC